MKRILLCIALLALLFTVLSAACASAAEIRPLEINPEQIDLNNGTFSLSLLDEDRIVSDGYLPRSSSWRTAMTGRRSKPSHPGIRFG